MERIHLHIIIHFFKGGTWKFCKLEVFFLWKAAKYSYRKNLFPEVMGGKYTRDLVIFPEKVFIPFIINAQVSSFFSELDRGKLVSDPFFNSNLYYFCTILLVTIKETFLVLHCNQFMRQRIGQILTLKAPFTTGRQHYQSMFFCIFQRK